MIQERNYKDIDRMLSLDSTRQLNNILRTQLLKVKKYTPKDNGLVIYDNGRFNPMITSTSLIKILNETQGVNKVVFYTTVSPHTVEILNKSNDYKLFYVVENSVISVNTYLTSSQSVLNTKMRLHKSYTSWTAIGHRDNQPMTLHLNDGSLLLCS